MPPPTQGIKFPLHASSTDFGFSSITSQPQSVPGSETVAQPKSSLSLTAKVALGMCVP